MTTRSQAGSSRRQFIQLLVGGAVALPLVARADEPAVPEDLKQAAQHVEVGGVEDEVAAAPPVAQRLFRDLVCLCGGCKRETLEKCTCAYAKAERDKVMAMLQGKDISTDAAAEKAYIEVRDALIKEYGGQHILTVPLDKGFNKLAWIVPWAVFGLALSLVLVVGQRWVQRGRQATAASRAGGGAPAASSQGQRKDLAEEEREDRLDDELRDID